jgi:enolase
MIGVKQMTEILKVNARQIIDSRGNPTVEVDVHLESGHVGRAAVPSGTVMGEYEAVELRDGDERKFLGKGVSKAVLNVNEIIGPEICGYDCLKQAEIDNLMIMMDGSEHRSNLGTNAILGVSLAVARAASLAVEVPLYRYIGGINARRIPVPMSNLLSGGKRTDMKGENRVDFKEFMIMPLGALAFSQALQMNIEVFSSLKSILEKQGLPTTVGDDGGFAPLLKSNEEALDYIVKAIEKSGYRAGKDVCIALDSAASEFYNRKKYSLNSKGKKLSSEEMIDYYRELVEHYPIVSIEDGLAKDDWKGWHDLTSELGAEVQIVGDDIFVTNKDRLSKGIKKKSANSILVKLSQTGTLTGTLETIEMAKSAGFTTVISHRSGETVDSFIADLAVAVNSGQIKTGSICRGERVEKYNQLIRIEEELGPVAVYSGEDSFHNLKLV